MPPHLVCPCVCVSTNTGILRPFDFAQDWLRMTAKNNNGKNHAMQGMVIPLKKQ